jgi:ABC-type transporter Mla subunit MlaD
MESENLWESECTATLNSAKDDCPCDLSLIEQLIQENITNLRIVTVLLNDHSKELDKKLETLNATSKAEHEAIDEAILSNGELIQNVTETIELIQNVTETIQKSVDDINLTKSPIGTILPFVPKVQQNKTSIIELPSDNELL